MYKRNVRISSDLQASSYDDEHGKSIVIHQTRVKSVERNSTKVDNDLVQVTKEEAFKLAHALMSLASEL